jgi:excisionase family DNA binding protein
MGNISAVSAISSELPEAAYMTSRQLAAYLNVSLKFIQKHTENGRLPVARFGRAVRFRRMEIEQRLLAGKLLLDKEVF